MTPNPVLLVVENPAHEAPPDALQQRGQPLTTAPTAVGLRSIEGSRRYTG